MAAVAVALGGVLLVVGAYGMPTLMLGAGQWPNPHYFGFFGSWGATILGAAQLATLAASLLASASLVVRWRRASDMVRRQILWVVLAFGVLCAVLVVDAAVAMLAPQAYPAVFPVIQLVPVVLPVAVAVAVLRFRLFDIEVLVSRAVVYGILTGVLLLTYAAVAAAVTSVLPAAGESAGRLLAAASVAVAFAPLRQWLQRRVGRRLFGARAEPYAALVDLSRELEASSPEQVLTTLAASVAQALKAPYAAIQAGWDTGTEPSGEAGRRPPDTANLVEMELTHAGSRVGRLAVAQRSRDAFSAADVRLLSDLARPIAAALQTLRLSMDLQKSRERLVLTVEEERRRLGRDLHDSLGPSLAAISMQVETVAGLGADRPRRSGAGTVQPPRPDRTSRPGDQAALAHAPAAGARRARARPCTRGARHAPDNCARSAVGAGTAAGLARRRGDCGVPDRSRGAEQRGSPRSRRPLRLTGHPRRTPADR